MSVQQDRYLAARAAGATMMTACVEAGIAVAEARLIENDIARGLVSLPDPQAQPKEDEMTRRKGASQKQDVEEVGQPDFERAVKIFRQDIKPANEASGESAQTASTGYKAIKKDCHVNTRAAKFVFKLASESEEKRNDVLRSVRGLLGAMGIGITDDLVSGAEGEDTKAPIVPAAKPELVTLATLN
jgi:hypothetical protein